MHSISNAAHAFTFWHASRSNKKCFDNSHGNSIAEEYVLSIVTVSEKRYRYTYVHILFYKMLTQDFLNVYVLKFLNEFVDLFIKKVQLYKVFYMIFYDNKHTEWMYE